MKVAKLKVQVMEDAASISCMRQQELEFRKSSFKLIGSNIVVMELA